MVKSAPRNSPLQMRLYPRVLNPHKAERQVKNRGAVHVLLQPHRCALSQAVLAVVVKTKTSHLGVPDFALVRNQVALAALHQRLESPTSLGVPDFALVRETRKRQENALVRNQVLVLYRRPKTLASNGERSSVPDFALVRNQVVLAALHQRLESPTSLGVPDFALVRETTESQ